MKKSKLINTCCRLLLGMTLLFFGANGLLGFMPVPPLPPAAEAFRQALIHTGYMIPFIKTIEFIGAGLLILNIWPLLALLILLPVTINIFFFHLFLAPLGTPLALWILFLQGYLLYQYRHVGKELFAAQ